MGRGNACRPEGVSHPRSTYHVHRTVPASFGQRLAGASLCRQMHDALRLDHPQGGGPAGRVRDVNRQEFYVGVEPLRQPREMVDLGMQYIHHRDPVPPTDEPG